jgi:cyanophycinase
MTQVVAAHPQLLGIGLDESTAIIVRGHVADVLGKNKAHFFDRTKPVAEGQSDFTAVAAGSGYDLKKREPIASR